MAEIAKTADGRTSITLSPDEQRRLDRYLSEITCPTNSKPDDGPAIDGLTLQVGICAGFAEVSASVWADWLELSD